MSVLDYAYGYGAADGNFINSTELPNSILLKTAILKLENFTVDPAPNDEKCRGYLDRYFSFDGDELQIEISRTRSKKGEVQTLFDYITGFDTVNLTYFNGTYTINNFRNGGRDFFDRIYSGVKIYDQFAYNTLRKVFDREITIKFQRLDERAIMPERATVGSAAYDVTIIDVKEAAAGGTWYGKTGLAVAIPTGYFGYLVPRSSTFAKHGITAHFGIIDADYRGEIMFAMRQRPQIDEDGTCLAQLLIMRAETARFVETGDIGTTIRGAGGFGSTGKN
jgi:dUTP pyrophosphatase